MRSFSSFLLCLSLVCASSLREALRKQHLEIQTNQPNQEGFKQPAAKRARPNEITDLEEDAISGLLSLRSSPTSVSASSASPTLSTSSASASLAPIPSPVVENVPLSSEESIKVSLSEFSINEQITILQIKAAFHSLDISSVAHLTLPDAVFNRVWAQFAGGIFKILNQPRPNQFYLLLSTFPQFKRVPEVRLLFLHKYPELCGTDTDQYLFGELSAIQPKLMPFEYDEMIEGVRLYVAIREYNLYHLYSAVVDEHVLDAMMPKCINELRAYLGTEELKAKFIKIINAFPEFKKRPEVRNLFLQYYPYDTQSLALITAAN